MTNSVKLQLTHRATVRRLTVSYDEDFNEVKAYADAITNLQCLLVLDNFDTIETAPVITLKAKRQGVLGLVAR